MKYKNHYFGLFLLIFFCSFTLNAQIRDRMNEEDVEKVNEEDVDEVNNEEYIEVPNEEYDEGVSNEEIDETEYVDLNPKKDPNIFKEYSEVEILCRCKVNLVISDEYKVTINATQELRDKFRIKQIGKKIVIKYRSNRYNKKYVLPYANVEFKSPMFSSLKISGKSEVNNDELIEVEKIKLELSDGAKANLLVHVIKATVIVNDYSIVNIEGETQDLKIISTKKGLFDAEDLNSHNVNVNITGSGKVTLGDIGGSVDIKINGTGVVGYKGNPPTTKIIIEGGGSVQSGQINLNE